MNRMKKLKKVVLVVSILFFLIILISIPCKALDMSNLNAYGQVTGNSTTFDDLVGKFITIIQVIGSILSVVCLIVIGVKYMTSSAQERAEYKKVAFPYLMGALMIFGITNLLGIIYHVTINVFQ